MKQLFKSIIHKSIENDSIWPLIDKIFVRFGSYARRHRIKSRIDRKQFILQHSPNLVVLNGPFKGLKYPQMISTGSTFCPKILGSYEKELHATLEQLSSISYQAIINIGCAEGYYAGGLARQHPKSRVYAYDSDPKAQELCRLLCKANNLSNVEVNGHCNIDTIKQLNLSKRSLFVIDCEGYEKALFDKFDPAFSGHDFLIEIHDLLDIEISTVVTKCFENTHKIEKIESIDDVLKPLRYDFSELNGLSLQERQAVLAEDRGAIMEWFLISPK